MLQLFSWAGCKKQCFYELLGTYLLVLIGPGSIVVASLLGFDSVETLVAVGAVFGCTVASVILLVGRRSGAHINPAITVASMVAGAFRREWFLPYIVSQVVGGLLAGFTLWLAFGARQSNASLGATKLAIGVSPVEGIALELAGTFVLAVSALTAGSSVKSPTKQAILVGGTLFVLILLIGPLTGASFNPARSLGPSLFSGYLSWQVVYYIGPVVGGAFAGLAFAGLKRLGV